MSKPNRLDVILPPKCFRRVNAFCVLQLHGRHTRSRPTMSVTTMDKCRTVLHHKIVYAPKFIESRRRKVLDRNVVIIDVGIVEEGFLFRRIGNLVKADDAGDFFGNEEVDRVLGETLARISATVVRRRRSKDFVIARDECGHLLEPVPSLRHGHAFKREFEGGGVEVEVETRLSCASTFLQFPNPFRKRSNLSPYMVLFLTNATKNYHRW